MPKEPWTHGDYFCQQPNSKLLSSSQTSSCTFLSFTVLVMDKVSCTFGLTWSLQDSKHKYPWEVQIYRVYILPSSLVNKGLLLHGGGRKSLLEIYASVLDPLHISCRSWKLKKKETVSANSLLIWKSRTEIFSHPTLDGDDSGQVELPSYLSQPTSENFFM